MFKREGLSHNFFSCQVFTVPPKPEHMQGAHGVPKAQKQDAKMKKLDIEVDTKFWLAKVRKGFEKIAASGRVTSEEALNDLNECVQLLEARDSAPFHWDISLYTNPHPHVAANNVPTFIQSQDAAVDLQEDHLEEHNSLLHQDRIKMPVFRLYNYHLIRLQSAPFWSIGR